MKYTVPAYEGKKPFIFVSYAHKDSDVVLPVIERLYKERYRVWYDEGIAAGSEWPRNIEEHLKAAKGVLIFISPQSLASENCKNEVNVAKKSEDKLIVEVNTATKMDDIEASFPDSFIGDGSGYKRKIGRKRFSVIWNLMLVLAILLMGAVGAGLYGMGQGWFDTYLPGLSNSIFGTSYSRIDNEADTAVQSDALSTEATVTVNLGDDLVNQGIISQIEGKDYLTEKLVFDSPYQRDSFLYAIGYQGDPDTVTIFNLTQITLDEVRLDECTDRLLEYLVYINGLKLVKVSYKNFKLHIPENAGYEVALL